MCDCVPALMAVAAVSMRIGFRTTLIGVVVVYSLNYRITPYHTTTYVCWLASDFGRTAR